MSIQTQIEQPKITLYWLEQSRSQRILWLLEELGLSYNLEIFHRDPKTKLAGPELKEVHALGKSPVISIQSSNAAEPTLIAESAFICEYLAEHFGQDTTLLPKRWKKGLEGQVCGETEEWMRYKYFLHYAEGSLMSFLVLTLVAQNIKDAPVPFFIRPITGQIANKLRASFIDPNLMTHYAFLEDKLKTATSIEGQNSYLCGRHLTAADILLSFPLIAAKGGRGAGLTKENFPKLIEYIERLEEEQGYKRSIEKIVEVEGKFSASM